MLLLVGGAALWGLLRIGGHFAGAARWSNVPRAAGAILVPHARAIRWNEQSELAQALIADWAAEPLPDWHEEGKVTAPRALLARFASGQDLEAANAYLLAQVPWGRSGSTWELHTQGDYDFTLAALTTMLYLYGDEPGVLYPETRTHLLDVLLVEEGGNPRVSVPRTLGLIRDTENHLLMTEGSRYLKNRWLMLHGSTDARYDNERNGMERWMLDLLRELNSAGLYEFNSIPYMGYTLTALLNLEAYGSDAVRGAAQRVLDRANWEYALGSLAYRRFAPFRRQLARAGLTALDADYHTALIRTWMSFYPTGDMGDDAPLTEGRHHALLAALLPYRPPDEVVRWILEKPTTYFVRIGHGPWASPEIYAGGPGYLLSAGGVHRGKRSMIVARPITLMLDDEARDLSDVLYLAGPDDTFTTWNNTGVYRDLACAAGPVHVPASWELIVSNDLWEVYAPVDGLVVVVHSQVEQGLVALFHDDDPKAVLAAVTAANSDPVTINRVFQWPDGPRITFNVNAPRNRWVIVAVDDEHLDTAFDRWPLLDGEIDEY